MKKLVFISALFVVILLSTNCIRDGKNHDVYFYTDTDTTKGPLTLYVNFANKGQLPRLNVAPAADSDTIIKTAMHMVLKSDRYRVEVKDANGNIKSSSILKFGHYVSNRPISGSQKTASNSQVVVMDMSY